jgi:hypothetical protein
VRRCLRGCKLAKVVNIELKITYALIEKSTLSTAWDVKHHRITGYETEFVVSREILAILVSKIGGRLRGINEKITK